MKFRSRRREEVGVGGVGGAAARVGLAGKKPSTVAASVFDPPPLDPRCRGGGVMTTCAVGVGFATGGAGWLDDPFARTRDRWPYERRRLREWP